MTGFLPSEIRDLKRGPKRIITAIALAGFLLRLFFWAYTDRTWEDALITVLHSENFARGLGLTHVYPGLPPVHGFTSPLSLLIPLPFDMLHPGWGLLALKAVSALLAIPTVLLAAAIALQRNFRLDVRLVYLLCCYLAFEHHQVLWGMAGMETQMATFALFFAMYQALRLKPVMLGLSMALCLYARPDFAIFLIFMAAYVLVRDRRALRTSALVGAAAYTPWLLFTTLYYGSPIPNTIVAKGIGYGLWTLSEPVFSSVFVSSFWGRAYWSLFMPLGPCFGGHGTGFVRFMDEGFLAHFWLVMLVFGALAMLREFDLFYVIPLGGAAAYSAYYIFCVQCIFGWYTVPFNAVNCLVLVLGLGALFRWLVLPGRITMLSRAAWLGFILPFIIVLPKTFGAERDIQRYIENPVRKAMGQYLFEHKKPGDRVACEPLGYMAYYSRMPVYDFPGLASAEVTRFIRANPGGRSLAGILDHFRPQWIALRQNEYQILTAREDMKFLQADYGIEKIFRADPQHAADIFRVGSNIDTVFYLLKKRS